MHNDTENLTKVGFVDWGQGSLDETEIFTHFDVNKSIPKDVYLADPDRY